MHGKLEKIHFPLPRLMSYLSEESKVSFLEQVGRDSANDKINGLLDEVNSFFMEMAYFMKLRKLGLRYDNNVMVYLRNFCLIISFIINILIIVDNEESFRGIRVIGIIAIILYSCILLMWLVFRMQLEYQKIYKKVDNYI